MTDEQGASNLASDVLARNVKRIREGRRFTFVELAERLDRLGTPIPVLGLRRIERGERRVDIDDLFALSVALDVHPIDLLVPGDMPDGDRYDATPNVSTTARKAREWISGTGFLAPPESAADLYEIIRWMPLERAKETAVKYIALLNPPEKEEQ